MTEHHPFDTRTSDLPLWQQKKPGRKARCLALLRSKPVVYTGELIREGGHRFATIIESLRHDGHVIDGRDLGSEWEYRYIRKEPVVRTSPTWQDRYYKTAHWQRIKELRLRHDNYRCVNCHTTTDLHVHHWRYDLFSEKLGDLMTLCQTCHKRMHGAVNIVFPKSVSVTIDNRIRGEG